MSELVSGKEALIALANGESVEACVTQRLKKDEWHWFDAKSLTVNEIEAMETDGNPDGSNILAIAFRLKPRTININGIEVPASSNVYSSGLIWILCGTDTREYASLALDENDEFPAYFWRSEDEIKQVVEALRQVFDIRHILTEDKFV